MSIFGRVWLTPKDTGRVLLHLEENMISIGCPNCGEELKNPADNCPHCKNTLPESIQQLLLEQKLLLEENPIPKRPIWVWVISIFILIGYGYSLVITYLVSSGVIVPLTLKERALFDSFNLFGHPLSFLTSLADILAAITLFLLRKVAFYLFSASFILYILTTAWQIQTEGWIAATPTSWVIGAFIGVGFYLALCLYSRNLIKKGILS